MSAAERKAGKMQGIGGLLPFQVNMKIIREFHCEACGMLRREMECEKLFTKTGETFVDITPCNCSALEIFKKQQEQAREEARKRKSAKAMALFEEKSLINTKIAGATFLNYSPPTPILANAKNEVMAWVKAYDRENPRNLILSGNYGTGKSHLSVAAAKMLMEEGITCIFVTVQKLMTLIKQTFDRGNNLNEGDLLTALEDVDVLILDDIGAEQLTEWSMPKLLEILDARQGKCMIYTTNHSEEELENKIGPRSVSRMFYEADEIHMTGPDYRRQKRA
jgi:DNA replication protein DnaC